MRQCPRGKNFPALGLGPGATTWTGAQGQRYVPISRDCCNVSDKCCGAVFSVNIMTAKIYWVLTCVRHMGCLIQSWHNPMKYEPLLSPFQKWGTGVWEFNQHRVTDGKQRSQNPTLVGPTSRAELLQTDSNLLVIDSKENAGSLGRSKAQPSTGELYHMTEEATNEGKARAGSLATVTASGRHVGHSGRLGLFTAS